MRQRWQRWLAFGSGLASAALVRAAGWPWWAACPVGLALWFAALGAVLVVALWGVWLLGEEG